MNRNIALIALGGFAAAGLGWWSASVRQAPPAPIIILQAPPAPATALTPVAAAVPEPAPVVAPAAAARRVARAVPKATAPRPAPAPTPAAEPEVIPAPEPVKLEPAPVETATEARPVIPAVFPTEKLPPPPPRSVTVPAGTLITVRLAQPLETGRNSMGDAFTATLDQPLVINGLVIAERGSRQFGKLALADQSGRVKGRAALGLELVTLNTADGQQVNITTEVFRHEAASSAGRDTAKAGVMAGIGAAIGAIAGGGKGAAIGAAAGGAAGAGTVLATRGQQARLPAETRISFRLSQPVTLTEKLD
jgi:hypothetical protein